MTRFVYVGTYTQSDPGKFDRKEGIYIYRMDPSTSELAFVAAVISGPNPSYLAVHPALRYLYTVNETQDGSATAFEIDRGTGMLTLVNSQSTRGSAPCYLSLDPTGRWLLVANYGTGGLAVLPILENGYLNPIAHLIDHRDLSVHTQRQKEPHAHSILFDPGGRFALAADLGMDCIFVYRFDGERGKLLPHEPPGVQTVSGAGPRHLAFYPDARYLYTSNELDSTVNSYRWDAQGGILQPLQTLTTLPPGIRVENSVADIHLDPFGKFLYVSNRGHNSLAIFAVNDQTGSLRPVGHASSGGDWPRNFAIDPSGQFLFVANQLSHTLVSFLIEPDTGQLSSTGQVVSIPSPVCVKIVDL